MEEAKAPRISIAVVDDHPVVIEGLITVLSDYADYRVVARGASAPEAETIAAREMPDVMLMDLGMPGDVFAAIAAISRTSVRTKVIVFTASSIGALTLKALDAGAKGVVLKGATCEELLEAIESVINGEVFISRQHASTLLLSLRNKQREEEAVEPVHLTVLEKQIVDQLLRAATNREIAKNLSISEKTVKRYMSTLMHKLGARNRVEVAVLAQKAATTDRS